MTEAWTEAARAALVGETAGLRLLDLDRGDRAVPGSCDLATAWTALPRAPDPVALLRTAHRALRPGGRLVVMIPHPGTSMPVRHVQRDPRGVMQWLGVDRYFDGNPLEIWFGWIRDAGFELTELREPRPTAAQVQAEPALDEATRVATVLLLELRKR